MKLRTVSLIFHDIIIVLDTFFLNVYNIFLKPSWRLFWFYRKYGKLSQLLVTDDVIEILTNQFRLKRAHHREDDGRCQNMIFQQYIQGILYENMNTSIKYVLQDHDEIK